MATKKVLVKINVEQQGSSVDQTTKDIDKLAAATKKLKYEQSDEAKELAKVNHQLKAQRDANKLLAAEQVNLAESVENTNGKMSQFKTTSGLTGALVTEFGRAASDSAYGIRGMGNNISQIVTLFGQLQVNVKKAGGTMKDSFAQIFQSMKGVIGIMTALQIVIGIVQTEWFQKWATGLLRTTGLLDLFTTKLGKLKDKLEGVAGDFAGMITELEVYTDILQDSTRSIDDKEKAYKKLIDNLPEMEDSIKRVGDEFVISAGAVDSMTASLEELAVSAAALERLKELRKELLKQDLQYKITNDEVNISLDENIKKLKERGILDNRSAGQLKFYRDKIQDVKTSEEERYLALVRTAEILEEGENRAKISSDVTDDYKDSLSDLSSETKEYASNNLETIKNTEKEIELLKDYIKLRDKPKPKGDPKDPLERRVSRFKEASFLLQSELQKYENELLKTTSRTNLEIIQDEGQSSKNVINIKTNEFKEREKLRLKNFIAQKEIDKKRKGITQAEKDRINKSIEKAKETSAKTIELADNEATKVIESINRVTTARTDNETERARIQKELDDGNLFVTGEQADLSNTTGEVARAEAQQSIDALIFENKKQNLENLINLEKEGTEKRIQLENQLDTLKIENNAKQLKNSMAVENSKLNLAESSASALSDLLGKQTKEGKILAATAATINTYQGISNALKTGTSPYKYVDAGITAVKGFSAVRSILNTNSPSTSDSTSSGSTTVQPPDFNIVGSTGVNQLADAIGSTEKQPVKAFVVASEVTTQQALDRNNRSNAEL